MEYIKKAVKQIRKGNIMIQAIADVQAGKYVDMDIQTAYEVICKTQSLGSDWNIFLHNAPSAVLHTEFNPCINIGNIREYVLRELKMPTHEDKELPLQNRIEKIFDSAMIYLQQYDIEIDGTKGKIFIHRTPTECDFDRARAVLLFVLEFFLQASKGDLYTATLPNSAVTITIRGLEKFFEINIKSGINEEAWIGFDFR
jgi:hypothetical protein